MDDSEYARRKELTFRQAEGFDPLPSQLAFREVSKQFRSLLYAMCHEDVDIDSWEYTVSGDIVSVLRAYWISVQFEPSDEFPNAAREFEAHLKHLCFSAHDIDVLQLFQFLLQRLPSQSPLRDGLMQLPEHCLLAYRPQKVGDGPTVLVPIASQESADAVATNLSRIGRSGALGAKTHALAAVQALNGGKWADAARESISIVEAIARHLANSPKADLAQAVQALEKNGFVMHPALKAAILKLYGYTSDEKGIRHSLVDDTAANVDENLALFLFSSCVAFGALLLASPSGSKRDAG